MIAKKFLLAPLVSLSLLLIPLTAMQFSDQVNWSLSDFVIMGILLLAVSYGISLVWSRTKEQQRRAIYIFLLLLAFVLIWAELAVGVFGSPVAGN